MKFIFILIPIASIWLSCSNLTKESKGKDEVANVDTLSLMDLEKKYLKTGNVADLKEYLRKIDIILAKDSNSLTPDNVGLAKTKLALLNFNISDSVNVPLMDSLNHRIISFYKMKVLEDPNNPYIYVDLGQMYYSPQVDDVDSASFYMEKALILCDSILKNKPYDENTYRLKIYTMLSIGKEKEAKKIIEKDRTLMKTNLEVNNLLNEIYKEIDF